MLIDDIEALRPSGRRAPDFVDVMGGRAAWVMANCEELTLWADELDDERFRAVLDDAEREERRALARGLLGGDGDLAPDAD